MATFSNGNVVAVGNYVGGIHHISTGQYFTGSADGHLLLADGVVVGDFVLQMNFDGLQSGEKVADLTSRPVIGTDGYNRTHAPQRKGEDCDGLANFVCGLHRVLWDHGPGELGEIKVIGQGSVP